MATKTKNKPNKGLLKRIRITGTRRVRFKRACGRHKRSHKPSDLLRSYRVDAFLTASDVRKVRVMLHTRVRSTERCGPKKPKPRRKDPS